MTKFNMDGFSFGEWYVQVANIMGYAGRLPPTLDKAQQLFDRSYDAISAAKRLAAEGSYVRDLLDAAGATALILENITAEQFSKGYDRPAREALADAIKRISGAGSEGER